MTIPKFLMTFSAEKNAGNYTLHQKLKDQNNRTNTFSFIWNNISVPDILQRDIN